MVVEDVGYQVLQVQVCQLTVVELGFFVGFSVQVGHVVAFVVEVEPGRVGRGTPSFASL